LYSLIIPILKSEKKLSDCESALKNMKCLDAIKSLKIFSDSGYKNDQQHDFLISSSALYEINSLSRR